MPTTDMVWDIPTLDIPTSDMPVILAMLDTMVIPDLLLMPTLPEPALPVWREQLPVVSYQHQQPQGPVCSTMELTGGEDWRLIHSPCFIICAILGIVKNSVELLHQKCFKKFG